MKEMIIETNLLSQYFAPPISNMIEFWTCLFFIYIWFSPNCKGLVWGGGMSKYTMEIGSWIKSSSLGPCNSSQELYQLPLSYMYPRFLLPYILLFLVPKLCENVLHFLLFAIDMMTSQEYSHVYTLLYNTCFPSSFLTKMIV